MDKSGRVVADDIWPKLISDGCCHDLAGYFAMKPKALGH